MRSSNKGVPLKEKFVAVLKLIKSDARFLVYTYTESGTYSSDFKDKHFVESLVKGAETVKFGKSPRDVILIDSCGISKNGFIENIHYETFDVEGFEELVSKNNPYFNVFIKIDQEKKAITFKLGEKSKTLNLIEYTGYTYKVSGQNLLCSTVGDLERHMRDEFWRISAISLGRKVLQMDTLPFRIA